MTVSLKQQLDFHSQMRIEICLPNLMAPIKMAATQTE